MTVSRREGAVSLEFMIAFPALWVFCLCVFQLVLLARTDIMVRHAADAAARSAAVVLPDDPGRYGGEPEMSVSRDVGRDREIRDTKQEGLGQRGVEAARSAIASISLDGRSRREIIGTAARVPLLALSPAPFDRGGKTTVRRALGSTRVGQLVGSRGPDVRLSFPGVDRGLVQGPEVTVEVTFTHSCLVPIARHILCERDSATVGREARVWRFTHATTSLVHDAPYEYRAGQES